jgi:hypothetical protein
MSIQFGCNENKIQIKQKNRFRQSDKGDLKKMKLVFSRIAIVIILPVMI